MSWHQFGVDLIAAVVEGSAAAGVALSGEVTSGEPAYECGEPMVAAWISGLPAEFNPVPCNFQGRVSWTLRLHHCANVNVPAALAEDWHAALEAVWCAASAFLLASCANCEITIDGASVSPPSGNQIVADLVITKEESCIVYTS